MYTLRLIFEEEREKVSLRNEILTTTGSMVHKMITLGIVGRKPSDRTLPTAGSWYSQYYREGGRALGVADTKLLILPSILFVVTNEKISRMYEALENGDNGEKNGDDGSDDADNRVIRGDDVL